MPELPTIAGSPKESSPPEDARSLKPSKSKLPPNARGAHRKLKRAAGARRAETAAKLEEERRAAEVAPEIAKREARRKLLERSSMIQRKKSEKDQDSLSRNGGGRKSAFRRFLGIEAEPEAEATASLEALRAAEARAPQGNALRRGSARAVL